MREKLFSLVMHVLNWILECLFGRASSMLDRRSGVYHMVKVKTDPWCSKNSKKNELHWTLVMVYFMFQLDWATVPRYLVKYSAGCFYEGIFGWDSHLNQWTSEWSRLRFIMCVGLNRIQDCPPQRRENSPPRMLLDLNWIVLALLWVSSLLAYPEDFGLMNLHTGLPRWLSDKQFIWQFRRHAFDPWVEKIPWRRKWQPPPVFLPGESHGQKSLTGCSPWGHKEVEMTEQLSTQWAWASIVTWANSLNLFVYPSVVLQSWGCKELDTTERLNWTEWIHLSIIYFFMSVYPPSSTYLFVSLLFINLSCTYFFIYIYPCTIYIFIYICSSCLLSICHLSVTCLLLGLFPWRTSANTTVEAISSTQNFLVNCHHPLTPSPFFRSIWL